MDGFLIADTAATWAAFGAVLAAAVALAAILTPPIRRYFSSRQSDRRDQDYLRGWKDDRGYWHTGLIDLNYGWDDEDGHHPGLAERVRTLESGPR